MNNEKIKNRILSFDILKLLSISLIFLYHIVVDIYILHPMYNLKFFMDIIDRKNINFIMISVSIFITISGITTAINHKNTSWLDFYKNRFIRILIPFYIVYVMYFIIKILTFHSYRFFGGINRLNIIWTIFGIDEYIKNYGINTFSLGIGEWFLGCIIICYLFFPLIIFLYKKIKIPLFILINIHILYLCIYINNDIIPPLHLNILYQIYFFIIGIYIGLNYEKIINLYKKHFLFYILFIFLLILFIVYNKNIYVNVIILTLMMIIISMCCFENGLKIIISNKIINGMFRFFTNISYEFFLIHHFVIYEVNYLIGYKKLRGYEMILFVIIVFIITILLSITVNKLKHLIKLK